MSSIFWILLTIGVLFVISYISKINKIKEGERKSRDEAEHRAKEKIMRPEKKRHEEEKKRWEDEYWRRQKARDRT